MDSIEGKHAKEVSITRLYYLLSKPTKTTGYKNRVHYGTTVGGEFFKSRD
jgi:hypothetical protein